MIQSTITPLRVLLVEDSEADVSLLLNEFRTCGYEPRWKSVETLPSLEAALGEQTWDLILSDHKLAGFTSRDVLALCQQSGSDAPVLIVSGAIGEEEAVEAMKDGASDYIWKDRLRRLIPAVERALKEAQVRRGRKRAEQARLESERRFQTLAQISPVGIFRTDANGNCVYVNERWNEITGLNSVAALSEGWAQALHPADTTRVLERWRRAVEESLPFHAEFRFQKAGGTAIWVLGQAVPERASIGEVAGFVGTITDITERKRGEEELEKTTERLHLLSRRLLEVQETERRHIARELHDEVGQALTAAKINLQAVQRFPDAATLEQRLEDTVKLVDGVLQQVRDLSLNLRPSILDDLGLAAALRWYVDQQAHRAGWRAQFHADPLDRRLDATLETACFRVAQEALTNIVRHAEAKSVRVELRVTKELFLTVRDDGIGFDSGIVKERTRQAASFGMLGMEERASLLGGRFLCTSTPGQGTEVRARFPLVFSAANEEDSDSENL